MPLHSKAWVFALASYLTPAVNSVQITVGTTRLGQATSRCSDLQQFACVNDVCDPASGDSYGNKCFNGDDTGTICDAGSDCSSPTAGHCLDTIISADGRHSTPARARNQGTDKHFYCLSVSGLAQTPVIVWENNDCSGQHCFIPRDGYMSTWSKGSRGNCIDINPVTPMLTAPCLTPGLAPNAPFSGDYEQGHEIWVGGQYGFPQDFTQSSVCDPLPASSQGDISLNLPDPPTAPFSDAYTSPSYNPALDPGSTDGDDGGDPNSGKRDLSLIQQRVSLTAPLRATSGTIEANFLATGRHWWFVTQALSLATVAVRQSGLTVDHIVELEIIVAYFAGAPSGIPGVSDNQWEVLSTMIATGGVHWITADCTAWDNFKNLCNSGLNLQGIDSRVNGYKNKLFTSLLPVVLGYTGRPRNSPDYQATWYRRDVVATLAYLQQTQPVVEGIAGAIGRYLDDLVRTQALESAFAHVIADLWTTAITTINQVLQNPDSFFRPG